MPDITNTSPSNDWKYASVNNPNVIRKIFFTPYFGMEGAAIKPEAVDTFCIGADQLLSGLIKDHETDWTRFSICLSRAKGEFRTSIEAAKKFGIEKTIFSKLLHGKYRGRISNATLFRIVVYAAPGSNVTLSELLDCLGKTPPHGIPADNPGTDPRNSNPPPHRLAGTLCLAMAGIGLHPDTKGTFDPKISSDPYTYTFHISVHLDREDRKLERDWFFRYITANADDEIRKIPGDFLFGKFPSDSKASLVTDSRQLYNKIKTTYKNSSTPFEISVILVGHTHDDILDEFQLPLDGEKMREYPTLKKN